VTSVGDKEGAAEREGGTGVGTRVLSVPTVAVAPELGVSVGMRVGSFVGLLVG